METNFEYLIQILRDPSLDTWTLEEQQEINNLDLSQGLHHFLYDAYTGIITYQPNKLKWVSSDIIYQSDHIIILDSDSTILPRPNLGTWVFTYANLVSPYRLIYETHFP